VGILNDINKALQLNKKPSRKDEGLQLTGNKTTVEIPYKKCRNCPSYKWISQIDWDKKQDNGYSACSDTGSPLKEYGYAAPPQSCPKKGKEIRDKEDYYKEFVFRSGMMAFDAFPNITACLEYIATNPEESMITREFALLALKREEWIV
jgi:hypothetical protein